MSASENSPEISERSTGTPGSSSYTPPVAPEPAQGLAYPMHPGMLFANPFMSPFMPQQPQDVPAAPPTAPAGFVFSPAQYQEMMQQYFQQMMMASSQFGGNMPFPMPFAAPMPQRPASQASQADSINEAINALKSTSLAENGHHEIPTATVAPIVPQPTSSNASPEKSFCQPSSNTDAECSQLSSSDEKEPSQQLQPKAATEDDRKQSASEDERTASLIRKQMTEIEKEISRRSQNKNIKQIDDRELADLIGDSGEQPFPFAANFAPDYSQSGLSYTPPAAPEKASTPPKTLNQLRSSFNLPESGPTTGPSISTSTNAVFSHGGQQQQAPCFAPPLLPTAGFVQQAVAAQPPALANNSPAFVNPFGQAQYQTTAQAPFVPAAAMANGDQAFTQELAASFLPQPAPEMVPQAAPPASGSGLGLAPPPPPSHPVHRKTSAPSTSLEWPEENKENGDEPVWVLRDSYMKRLKRDEAAQQQQKAEELHPETVTEMMGENGDDEGETDRLIADEGGINIAKKKNSKEMSEASPSRSASNSHIDQIALVHEPAVLIEGVLFRARYLGSTQMMCESRSSKAARMHQAQEAVARVKAPDGEIQPSTEIDLFISTEKIMVLNTDLQRISETDVRQDILMDHALRTISYIADIGDLVVLMARRMSASDSDEQCNQMDGVKRAPKVICHVFESDEASFIAQSIGQAFQVAYVEFLRANGIDDPSYLRQIDYQEVLNSQELMGDELELFARKETQKDVVVPKKSGEPLGIVVVESGWGSMLPTVVLAHMNPVGPAARSNLLNIGDQIININGISLVGLPLSAAQTNIKNMKTATAVRLTIVSTPPVVEVRIRRPDTKYQLGFSVQNGVICSLLRGGIAERGGIRVGHRIIEINGQSVVAVAHDRIVNMLATAIGEIHMKTMPTSMFRLLTGQEVPQYI